MIDSFHSSGNSSLQNLKVTQKYLIIFADGFSFLGPSYYCNTLICTGGYKSVFSPQGWCPLRTRQCGAQALFQDVFVPAFVALLNKCLQCGWCVCLSVREGNNGAWFGGPHVAFTLHDNMELYKVHQKFHLLIRLRHRHLSASVSKGKMWLLN